MNHNEVIYVLFNKLGTNYTRSFVKTFFKIQSEPVSPHTISGLLDEYKIESMVVQITSTQLREVDFPVLAIMDSDNKDHQYALIKGLENNHVEYMNKKKEYIHEPIESFVKKWTGTAILIDAINQKPERGYESSKHFEQKKVIQNIITYLFFSATLVSVFFLLLDHDPLISIPLLVLKSIGIYITVNLIKESSGIQTLLANRICTLNNSTNCKKVITSRGGKLAGVSLSDLGFLYFSFTTVLVLSSIIDRTVWSFIYCATLLTLPFTIFSIIYQWRILKLWCPLCLIVVATFWLELVILLQKPFTVPELAVKQVAIGLGIIGIMTYFFYAFKKEWLMGQRFLSLQKRFHSFRNNEGIITAVIENGKRVTDLPLLTQMELGNPGAENELMVITGPTCKACVAMHRELEHLIDYFEESLSVQIIPSITYHDKFSSRVSMHMIDILTSDISGKLSAINAWFGTIIKDDNTYHEWQKKYNVAHNLKAHQEIMDWLLLNKIDYTPCLILNKKVVNPEYGLSEVKRYLKNKLT